MLGVPKKIPFSRRCPQNSGRVEDGGELDRSQSSPIEDNQASQVELATAVSDCLFLTSHLLLPISNSSASPEAIHLFAASSLIILRVLFN